MIEELTAILELLGDVSGIAGWLFGAFLTFKLIIMLSTTGATVYLVGMGIKKFSEAAMEWLKVRGRPKVKDVDIMGITITHDGTYDNLVKVLKVVRDRDNGTSPYLHARDVVWLGHAIEAAIKKENC